MSSIYVVSLGCNKNLVDTEVMLGWLEEGGHTFAHSPEKAEVIIINTCGFIAQAKQEGINTIFEMLQFKPSCRAVIATGCLSERYSRQLMEEIPELDGLMGVYQYSRINQCIQEALEGKRPVYTGGTPAYLDCFASKRKLATPQYMAYLKISEGCNNHCGYCAIPGIRGKYTARSFDSLINEAKMLKALGVKELNITAQDITVYKDGDKGLLELIKALDSLGFEWLRLLYAYPGRVSDELLEYMNNSESVCNYLDVPVQHVQDGLLRAMNRHYTQADITYLYNRIRSFNSGWGIRTTVMTGYPGETSRDFNSLLNYITVHPFDHLGAFVFSPEEDTPAYNMEHKVRASTAEVRLDGIMLRQGEISHSLNQERIGKRYRMLIEGRDEQSSQYFGRCFFQGPDVDGKTFLSADAFLRPGDMVNVVISDAFAYDLYAQLV